MGARTQRPAPLDVVFSIPSFRRYMGTTLKDIAQRTNLAVSTVSRVLNGKAEEHRISEETQEHVMQVAAEMDYRPNELARGLRLQKTFTAGLVVPNITNPLYSSLVRTIQARLDQREYSLMICDSEQDVGRERKHLEQLASRSVDGMIVIPNGLDYDHLVEIRKDGIPMVLVDGYVNEVEAPSVAVDNYGATYEATTHLIENGHRRIGFVRGLMGTHMVEEREKGFRAALEDEGVAVDENLLFGEEFTEQTGFEAIGHYLDLDVPPTAVLASDHQLGAGVIKAVRARNLSVPEELSLVVFNDPDYTSLWSPPITTIRQPVNAMGRRAADLLLDEVDELSTVPQRLVLSTELVVRQSVQSIQSDQGQIAGKIG